MNKKAKVVTGISVGIITGVAVATLTYFIAGYCMAKSTFKDLLEK